MVAGETVLKKTKDSPVVLMRLHRLYILRFGGIKCKENANANIFNKHGAIYLILLLSGKTYFLSVSIGAKNGWFFW